METWAYGAGVPEFYFEPTDPTHNFQPTALMASLGPRSSQTPSGGYGDLPAAAFDRHTGDNDALGAAGRLLRWRKDAEDDGAVEAAARRPEKTGRRCRSSTGMQTGDR